MSYRSLNELPVDIRSTLPQNLPKQAKDVYLKAFNNVYSQYKSRILSHDKDTREKMAHLVAWNVLKNKASES